MLNDNNYSIEDSLVFSKETTNKSITEFFRFRNTENVVLKMKNFKKGKPATKTDSATMPKGNIISVKEPITRNKYITDDKGIDKKAEAFLKDSFNYKPVDTIKWSLSKKWKNTFVEKNKYGTTLRVSKPVYNLDKNKAIMHLFESSKGWRNITLYFLSKENEKWKIIYKENRK